MRLLWPPEGERAETSPTGGDDGPADAGASAGRENGGLTDDELAAAYGYPDDLNRPYVRVNFVSSADGSATVEGLSEGLGSDADHRLFGMLRQLAEVILVGAGTARAEGYRGARRPTRGKPLPPPIAVVTASAMLDPDGPLFTDTKVAPLILTVATASEQRRSALAAAGAEVIVVGEERVEPAAVLDALAERGLHRVLCEGGPSLFGDLIAADAVDELCLTLAPTLVGGTGRRVSSGPPTELRALRLACVITADDVLLLRYQRRR